MLFTSTMLSGLRAGVLCGLAMVGPGGPGPGPMPQAARRGAGAQPGRPARAVRPLAVTLAPPSHPDHDVKGAATRRDAQSTFPRKRGGATSSALYVFTLWLVRRESRKRDSANLRGE